MIVVKKTLPPRREWKCRRHNVSVIARYEDTALKAIRIKLEKEGKRMLRRNIERGDEVPDTPLPEHVEVTVKPPRRPSKMAKPAVVAKYERVPECPWPINQGSVPDIKNSISHAYRNGKLTIDDLKKAERWENVNLQRGTVIKVLRSAMRRLDTEAQIKI